MSTTDFGRRLRSWRHRTGLALDQTARLIGVSLPCVSHWEAGRRLPSHAHRERIHELSGIRVDEQIEIAASADYAWLPGLVAALGKRTTLDKLEPELRAAIIGVPTDRRGALLEMLRGATR